MFNNLGTCSVSNDNSESVKGDVLFLLDSSSSVGKEQFMRAIRLIEKTVSHFKNVGPNGIQVSLVQYNREPFLEFSFRKHSCLPELIDDIRNTEFMNGLSNLGRAIEKVMKFAFTKTRGDRPEVENVLVIVTDGQSDDKVQLPYEISYMNSTTVLVIATLEANMNDIMELANQDHDKVFNLTDALKKPLGQRLAEHIKNLLLERQSTATTASISSAIQTTEASSSTFENDEYLTQEVLTSTIYTEKTHEAIETTPVENPQSTPENEDGKHTGEAMVTQVPEFVSTMESLETMVEHAVSEELEAALTSTTTSINLTTTSAEELTTGEQETLPFVPVELVETTPQTVEVEVSTTYNEDDVNIECLPEGIQAYFRLSSNFSGAIVAKDHEHEPNCSLDVAPGSSGTSERIVAFEINKEECGLHSMKSTNPNGVNQSIVINLLHNKRLVTANDRAYIIECFTPVAVQESELEARLDIGQGVPWSKTIQVRAPMPKCHYSLRRDSPHGPLIQFARIGEIIYHRWECDGGKDANSVYGLHIHDCRAGNNSENVYKLVDEQGCSTDNVLLKEITYSEDELVAYAKSQVFTLVDVDSLKFTCKVGLCLRDGDGCEGFSPPTCPGTNASEVLLSRTIRRCDEALEAALTSELEASLYDIRDPSSPVEVRRALSFSPIGLVFGAIVLGCVLGGLFYLLRNHSTLPTKKLDEESLSSEYINFEEVTNGSPTIGSPQLGGDREIALSDDHEDQHENRQEEV
uniref:VWFA domain-containing protein n=1 Tax=Acrobeloides nanus TaxID=290746 RepID=A0A914ECR0_9BILA